MPPRRFAPTVVLLVAAALAGGETVVYEPPARGTGLQGTKLILCACNKCGSTTLFCGLHAALSSDKGRNCHAPDGWTGVPHVRYSKDNDIDEVAQMRINVIRDPIDRYISGFHDKVGCCPGSTTRPCQAQDLIGRIRHLLPRELRGHRSCLTFNMYVKALGNAFETNPGRRRIDHHFRPQDLVCTARSDQPTLTGTLSELQPTLAALRWPGLSDGLDFSPRHTDGGRQRNDQNLMLAQAAGKELQYKYNLSAPIYAPGLRQLCRITQREYSHFGRPIRRECSRFVRNQSHAPSPGQHQHHHR